MKTKPLFAVALALWIGGACRATLEFTGYTQLASESKFAIRDTEEKSSSGWIAIGSSFKGYTLVAFNREKELLTVKNGNSTLELPLKLSRVREGKAPEPVAVPTPAPDIATQLAEAKKELAELQTKYREAHPTMQALLRKIAALEAQAKQ